MNVRSWLAERHSLLTEALLILGLYGAYELARGLVVGNAAEAERHAHRLVAVERSLHVFGEASVQHAADAVPGLTGTLGTAYLTLHLTITAAVLLWLHQRRPAAFAFVRTTLLVASGLALIGFLLFPTAPPRLAGIGIADTVSNGAVSLNHGLVSSLYNPYAAVPSMHIGYALVIGACLLRYARPVLLRALGALYAPAVLLVVVATGNHFFLDAAAGALVVGLGAAATAALFHRQAPGRLTALPVRREPVPAIDRRAA
jgi:PAP2 superfamily